MAETETETTETETGTEEQTSESQDSTDWKAMARKHEREAKAARKEADALRTANQSEAEKALELARQEGETAARASLAPELATARLEAAVLRSAGTKLADPADALRFIDAATVTTDDGIVDTKKLGAAVDELIAAKPYLAAGFKPGPPGVAGGPRGTTDGPTDMNALIRQGRS